MSLLAPRLLVFTEQALCAQPEVQLRPLLEAAPKGAVLVILRDKTLSFRARLGIVERLGPLVERTQQALAVAERLDLALAVGARAVHLPASGVPAEDARRLLPSAFLSRALHEGVQLTNSEQNALDAVVVSPLFAERKGRAPLGLAAVDRFRRAYPRLALYGLGGVTVDNVESCFEAGLTGVAVQGAALSGDLSRLSELLFGRARPG
jgi:thiamine-phosphate pyrophosphorylase